jgi:hypothetical protein
MDLSDITSLPPEQLAALRKALGIADVDPQGRSPIRTEPLHDLRLLPSATDPRPTFFWSAQSPRNAPDLGRTTPYPRLMWSSTSGEEITVTDAKEQATYTAKGFVLTSPTAVVLDPADEVRAMMDALSPEDRKAVIAAAKVDRLAKVQEKAANLSDADLDALLSSMEPAKRGPGRPPNPRSEVA